MPPHFCRRRTADNFNVYFLYYCAVQIVSLLAKLPISAGIAPTHSIPLSLILRIDAHLNDLSDSKKCIAQHEGVVILRMIGLAFPLINQKLIANKTAVTPTTIHTDTILIIAREGSMYQSQKCRNRNPKPKTVPYFHKLAICLNLAFICRRRVLFSYNAALRKCNKGYSKLPVL